MFNWLDATRQLDFLGHVDSLGMDDAQIVTHRTLCTPGSIRSLSEIRYKACSGEASLRHQ